MCIKIHAGLLNTLWLVQICCIHVNLTIRNYVKFPYTSCKAQSHMMIHHNHFPVPFYLSVWICFEILFEFSSFWEFLEQQAFLFSDTSLGLNILQTYLSMIKVLFFTGSYTKSFSLLLYLPSDELKSKSCSISTWIYAIISKFHSLAKQTVLLHSCVADKWHCSMWEFNLKSVLLMPG